MTGYQPELLAHSVPLIDGTYACEVYHGWKLLEWKKGQWWHMDCVGVWPGEIQQWVGPLPVFKRCKPKMEFDL